MNVLLARAEAFLREQGILQPAEDTLRRLIVTQRQAAGNSASLRQRPLPAISDQLPGPEYLAG